MLRSALSRLEPSLPSTPEERATVEDATESASLPETAPDSLRAWLFASALAVTAVLWVLVWYGDTVASIVGIWSRSDTFAHGFLILPISAWLIWGKRRAVMALSATPNILALCLLLLAGFGWLLGELAEARVVQQFALAGMIPLIVWATLGTRVAWVLAFPLAYLLFAVPFGEFLERPLMEHTADFTVAALKLTGIPVYREGQYFMIPSGSWSVVEACSGLRYLIASLTLGVLYAYLMYRSPVRRIVFALFSVAVPIVANWLRAYMIVMIGHLSGMKYAAGVDHLIYGWLFFGVVMLVLFWIGSFWREDGPRPVRQLNPLPDPKSFKLAPVLAMTLAASVAALAWPVIASRLDAPAPFAVPSLRNPDASSGWEHAAREMSDWSPRFVNATASVRQTYEKANQRVAVYIGYYSNQRQGAQLITSQNVLIASNDRVWRNSGERLREIHIGDGSLPLIEARLKAPARQLLVWRWYWVDGRYVVNPYMAKLLQARSKLLGRGDEAAVVMAYAETDEDVTAAESALQDFVPSLLPSIMRSLENARGR